MIKWRNWCLPLVSSQFEDSEGKDYADFFSLLRSCTPMEEAEQSHTSTSWKGNFILQIFGMGYMKYTQEERCPKPALHGTFLTWATLTRVKL